MYQRCWDWYDDAYYKRSPEADPLGASWASGRVFRGGNCGNGSPIFRSAMRNMLAPWDRYITLDFRVAVNQSTEINGRLASTRIGTPQPPESASPPPADVLTPRPKAGTEPTSPQQSSASWTSPSTGMPFVRIAGGEFMMASPDDYNDAGNTEKPQHKVRISTFYFGMTEVTRGKFRRFVDRTAYKTDAEKQFKGGVCWDESWKGGLPSRRGVYLAEHWVRADRQTSGGECELE